MLLRYFIIIGSNSHLIAILKKVKLMQNNFLNLKPGDRAKVTVFGQGDPNCCSKLLTMRLIS